MYNVQEVITKSGNNVKTRANEILAKLIIYQHKFVVIRHYDIMPIIY